MIGFASLKILKSNGTPRVHQDGINQLRYDYSYDSIGRLIRTDISDSTNGTAVGSTEFGYNTRGHLISVSNEIGGNAYSQYYSYSDTGVEGALANAKDGLPTRYTALGKNTDYSYDSLNRINKRNVDLENDIETLYFYHGSERGDNYATTQLSCENLNGTTYAYTYDSMGNITEIKKNGNPYRGYIYDNLGQLILEKQYDNKKAIEYQYNHLGNIRLKAEYQYTDSSLTGSYTLALDEYYYGKDGKDGWNYLLTGYDTNGNGVDDSEKISYDNIGNPIVYRGAQMAWKGRQLTGYAKNGTMSTFTYDADGLRGSKTVDGVKTVYQYVGDKLYYEKRGDSQEFYYFYDSYGNLASIYYTFTNGTYTSSAIYRTLTNVQGDVVAIYNNSGALVARYEYDAWGNILAVNDANGNAITQWYHIANANPIRYRGYYYDADLGLYYLQSRYYDSEIGRFINADGTLNGNGDIIGFNMFIYCSNNPVMFSDESGCGFFSKLIERAKMNLKYSVSQWLAPIKAISISFGYGIGLGIGFNGTVSGVKWGVEIKDTETTSVEIVGGKCRGKFSCGENFSVSFGELFETGRFAGYSHYYDDENCNCGGIKGNFEKRNKCPANTYSIEDSQVLGVSASLYIGVGGEASFGLDLNAWLEEKHKLDKEFKEFNESWSWDD